MASLTQWTWVWVDSWCWWWTGRLACCSSWGRKESDMTERLNWTELSASVVSQTVKDLPAMWKTWVQSLGWEDPLEKEMENHSNTLAWRIRWTEEPCQLLSMGSHRVGHDWVTSIAFQNQYFRTCWKLWVWNDI